MPDEQTTANTEEIVPPKKRPDLLAGAQVTPIIPRSIEEVFRVARAVIMAGLAPDSYTRERGQDLPEDKVISRVVIGIMKGAEVGLPPITALSTIAIINNRPCVWGDGAVALIQASGKLEKMTIEYIGEMPDDGAETGKFARSFGRRVTMWRVGQSEPYIGEFTAGDAVRAHLWLNPKRVPWIEHPKRMLKWRAFSQPASDGFSDCLMGLMIREVVEDLPPDAPPPADTSFLTDDAPMPQQQLAAPDTARDQRVGETPSPGASTPEPASASTEREAPSAAAGDAEAAPAAAQEPAPAPGEPELPLDADNAIPAPTVLEIEPDADEQAVVAWCKVASEILSVAPTPKWIDGWLVANEPTLNRIKTAGTKGVRFYKRIIERASERAETLRAAA